MCARTVLDTADAVQTITHVHMPANLEHFLQRATLDDDDNVQQCERAARHGCGHARQHQCHQ